MTVLIVTRGRTIASRTVVVTDTEYAVYYCDAPITDSHHTCSTNNAAFVSDIHWLAAHLSTWKADGCTVTEWSN